MRKLTALPADNLSLPDRGRLKAGYADVVVFDPDTIQDHATYDKPHQLSTGVSQVVVNGKFALRTARPRVPRPGASYGAGRGPAAAGEAAGQRRATGRDRVAGADRWVQASRNR